MEIVIASNNMHKIEELNAMAEESNIHFIPMKQIGDIPEIIEDGLTFTENAFIKARTIASMTDLPVLADDSGIAIDYLNGEPGIHSARYKGITDDREKNKDVLNSLNGVPFDERTARFVCLLAYIDKAKREYSFEGICEGHIHTEIAGSEGFGYDPIFYLKEKHLTMAEISQSEKNKISHRAQALEKFFEFILNQ
jgi:XTP/dITP diphosphohydrolase